MEIKYDFEYVELAVEYFKTGDAGYLQKIAETGGARHIFSHAKMFQPDFSCETPLEMITGLLTGKRDTLPDFVRNIQFAREHIANGFAERVALEYLPKDFTFTGTIFFTYGYDIGVGFGKNCSLNLGYWEFLKNPEEAVFWAVHEMHHAGFTEARNMDLPSMQMKTYGELVNFFEVITHLEGMGTYAVLDLRNKRGGLDSLGDYATLQNPEKLEKLEAEFFEVYRYFRLNPDNEFTDEDWKKIFDMMDKRHFYTVGAKMAKRIDCEFGRERLTGLISQPSSDFFALYLNIKQQTKEN